MIQYLTIKGHTRPRKDQKPHAQAFVVKKTRKYGEEIERKAISTKRPALITGAHASGKSYWLNRLKKDAARVWASRTAEPLYLHAGWSLADWTQGQHLETWWEGKGGSRTWKKLTAGERQRALADYLAETKAVLFIDDAHKLTGKKLLVVQDCVRAAGVWVLATQDEGRLSPGLRRDVLGADPQTFRLSTDVAYDHTTAFVWIIACLCMLAGFYELAGAMAGLKVLASGLRATKQS